VQGKNKRKKWSSLKWMGLSSCVTILAIWIAVLVRWLPPHTCWWTWVDLMVLGNIITSQTDVGRGYWHTLYFMIVLPIHTWDMSNVAVVSTIYWIQRTLGMIMTCLDSWHSAWDMSFSVVKGGRVAKSMWPRQLAVELDRDWRLSLDAYLMARLFITETWLCLGD